MKLRFTKMQGAGNDFVVLNGVAAPIALSAAQIRALADRRFGVGADQILMVEPSAHPELGIDFGYRIFNADGGEVEQCGNGARCFVKFVHAAGLTSRRSIRVQTRSGVIEPRLEEDGQVTVDMGPPRFDPAAVGFDAAGLSAREHGRARLWPLTAGGTEVWVSLVSMGNPHAVVQVDDVERAPVTTQGPLLELHTRFAHRVNVGYMQVLDRHALQLRVWERGAGETLACGTGACAAAVAAIERGLADSPLTVHARGGALRISWNSKAERNKEEPAPVLMTGPAVTVFEGEIEI